MHKAKIVEFRTISLKFIKSTTMVPQSCRTPRFIPQNCQRGTTMYAILFRVDWWWNWTPLLVRSGRYQYTFRWLAYRVLTTYSIGTLRYFRATWMTVYCRHFALCTNRASNPRTLEFDGRLSTQARRGLITSRLLSPLWYSYLYDAFLWTIPWKVSQPLVGWLARGIIPEVSLRFLATATLLPLQPRPDKIRPIAVGQCLRRPTIKVLLRAALSDSRNFPSPEKLANGILSAMDGIFYGARMLSERHGSDSLYVMTLIDARNGFNNCSRQAMLDTLPIRAPSLAHFINAMYARTIPGNNPTTLPSLEGTQRADPSSMILFYFTIQPLIRRISRACNFSLNC